MATASDLKRTQRIVTVFGIAAFLVALTRGRIIPILIIALVVWFAAAARRRAGAPAPSVESFTGPIPANPLHVMTGSATEFFQRSAFPGRALRAVRWGAFLLVVLIVLANSIVVIEAGQTGVYSLFGRVHDEELRSGIHLINPLARITRLSVRTEEYTMSVAQDEGRKVGDDSIAALTKEGLSVSLDVTALYHLDEAGASEVYRTIGTTYEEKIVRPAIRSAIREVVAQYDTKDIYSDRREEANRRIHETLAQTLEPRGIVLETVLLRNVELPQSVAQAIRQKLEAEQEAQKYDFVLQKERKEADRKRIEAEGQRDSQRIVSESLTDRYLEYLYVTGLKDRQGTIYVPTSPTTGLPLFRDAGK